MNNDCLFYVFGFLDVNSIVSCLCVCKRFYGVIKNEVLWKQLFNRHYWAIKNVHTNYYCTFKKCYTMDKFFAKYSYHDMNIEFFRASFDLSYLPICNLHEGIGLFTNIKILYLHNCMLSTLPEEIGQCYSLERLRLETNKLCSIPTSIGSLT